MITYMFLQLEQVWVSPTPMFDASVGMKPNSTYTKFFKQALLDLVNNGQMQKYRSKHSKSNAGCIPKRTKGTVL